VWDAGSRVPNLDDRHVVLPDPMILADEVFAVVARDLAELFVHVRNAPRGIRRRHDRSVIERAFEIEELSKVSR
jgi:hypothetical protein